jgi:hypothetical protein
MVELVSFFPGLTPADYWNLTGYERMALVSWRTGSLEAQQRAFEDQRWQAVAAAERNP